MAGATNKLYYGDNLQVMREQIPSSSVDLVYLDPPFNSDRNYSVLFKTHSGEEAAAQIEAFDDTWTWSHEAEATYQSLVEGGAPVGTANAIEAMRKVLGSSDMLAYLVMMTPRLLELHRILKPTGSLYLHCDPTASHYLKVMLDAIFGPEHFLNEIIWKRTTAHSSAKRYGPVHDVILYYGKTQAVTWTDPRIGYEESYLEQKYRQDDGDGRRYQNADLTANGVRNGRSGVAWRGFDPNTKGNHWKFTVEKLEELDRQGRIYWPPGGGWPRYKRYLDELKGLSIPDVWTDIAAINARAAERLGYPTQKPLALLERILEASSNPGDVVFDPFCGCGTTVDAAQNLGRSWLGIDVTYLSVDLIDKRLRHTYGESIRDTYEIVGIPRDLEGARALFKRNPFDFERWAVSLVNAQPNEKQRGDKGVDGRIRFYNGRETELIIVSVKGGKVVRGMVDELAGAVRTNGAAMGVLVTLEGPTRGMADAASTSGLWTSPSFGDTFPKVQVITIEDLLAHKRPKLPPTLLPYIQAQRRAPDKGDQGTFDGV